VSKTRSKLLVTLVLVVATAVLASGLAQARSIGLGPSVLSATSVPNPVVTPSSGEPDVGQTVTHKSLSRPGAGPRVPGFRWTGGIWVAWYLRIVI
jgi:hypothetical protein